VIYGHTPQRQEPVAGPNVVLTQLLNMRNLKVGDFDLLQPVSPADIIRFSPKSCRIATQKANIIAGLRWESRHVGEPANVSAFYGHGPRVDARTGQQSDVINLAAGQLRE